MYKIKVYSTLTFYFNSVSFFKKYQYKSFFFSFFGKKRPSFCYNGVKCALGDMYMQQDFCHVIWCGASSISMRKVSIGVSPISLKKNRCSRHFSPMERRAGRRRSSLANLKSKKKKKNPTQTPQLYPHDLHTVSIYTNKEPKSVLKYRRTEVLLHQ